MGEDDDALVEWGGIWCGGMWWGVVRWVAG